MFTPCRIDPASQHDTDDAYQEDQEYFIDNPAVPGVCYVSVVIRKRGRNKSARLRLARRFMQ
jgi:hypothetical protein